MPIQLDHATNGVKLFSVSTNTGFNAAFHRQFRVTEGSFDNVLRCAVESTWSPIVWRGGGRKKANFVSCEVVALDIDSDLTIDDAAQWLKGKGYRAAILTTKSHQKQKGNNPPCDRFRILIDAERIDALDQYEENMLDWIKQLPMADSACKDGARLFFASPQIVYRQDGKVFQWKNFTAQIQAKKNTADKWRDYQAKKFRVSGAIPEKLRAFILRGVPEGERHKACYWLGVVLCELGINADDTVRLICAGPLAALGMAEITRTVTDARKVAKCPK